MCGVWCHNLDVDFMLCLASVVVHEQSVGFEQLKRISAWFYGLVLDLDEAVS